MKQEILCSECDIYLRALFENEPPLDGEHVKFVHGRAKKTMFCDGCVYPREIKRGDSCTAFSLWADYGGIPYYPWEQDYIKTEAPR